ncbi:MAG: hypothetical protein JG771_1091, partial [Methermicoccus sp.]|nr:hypothetical protein [Methermicoccus sp.]
MYYLCFISALFLIFGQFIIIFVLFDTIRNTFMLWLYLKADSK